ncbi:hypothetical protein [Arthrobacter monumenti]
MPPSKSVGFEFKFDFVHEQTTIDFLVHTEVSIAHKEFVFLVAGVDDIDAKDKVVNWGFSASLDSHYLYNPPVSGGGSVRLVPLSIKPGFRRLQLRVLCWGGTDTERLKSLGEIWASSPVFGYAERGTEGSQLVLGERTVL